MNEGINNDGKGVSLNSLLESKKSEISQKKADEQRQIKEDQLEDLMNEVDDKRTKIGNLSEKKTNLTEKQDNLSESLNSIKESVKVFKESKQNLKDLYQKAKSDSDLEAFLKENGIESWEDLTKSEEFAKTDEVSSFSKSKEDIKKSVEGRKSQEEKIRQEYGLDESFKGKVLEEKLSEEKSKIKLESDELKMETPEGQKEIKDEAKNESENKMNSWFDEQIKSKVNEFLETGNFEIFRDCNLINEAIDLSKEAIILNQTPEELWKKFYEQKVDEIVEKNKKLGIELNELVDNLDLKIEKENFDNGSDFRPYEGMYISDKDPYTDNQYDNIDYLIMQSKVKKFTYTKDVIGLFSSEKLENERHYSDEYGKVNKDEKGICSVSILNRKKIGQYQNYAEKLARSLSRMAYTANNYGREDNIDGHTLFDLVNGNKRVEDLKVDFNRVPNKTTFEDDMNNGKKELKILMSLNKNDLTRVEISEDLYNFLTSEENKGKSINKIKLEFDSKSEKQKQRQTLLKEKIPSKIYLEQLRKEYQKMDWSSEESKAAMEEKQNRSEKIEEAEKIISNLKDFSLNFNSNSLIFDEGKLVSNIKNIYDDGTYPWPKIHKDKMEDFDKQIAELKERKAERNIFQGKLKKEDEIKIEKLETEKEKRLEGEKERIEQLKVEKKESLEKLEGIINELSLSDEDKGKILKEIIDGKLSDESSFGKASDFFRKKDNLEKRIKEQQISLGFK